MSERVTMSLVALTKEDKEKFKRVEGALLNGVFNEERNKIALENGKVLWSYGTSYVNDVEKTIWAPEGRGNDFYVIVE